MALALAPERRQKAGWSRLFCFGKKHEVVLCGVVDLYDRAENPLGAIGGMQDEQTLYFLCHMMTSLDGKIMGAYMETPEGNAAGDVFYNIAFGKDPYYKHQGWLSGRITTDDNFTFYEQPELDEQATLVPEGDYIAQQTGMY